MCTVVIDIPDHATDPIRLLAVRDEDPARPWDPPGPWWPERYPGVLGVRDRRANGAWLAEDRGAGALSVILNRADEVTAGPGEQLASRGALVLDSVVGGALPDPIRTGAFNLIELRRGAARVTSWDGTRLERTELTPGVHMIAHHDVDDPRTARIERWLPEFRAHRPDSGHGGGAWRGRWLEVLRRSAGLDATDDRAIIRDNRPHGLPTLSLFVCLAEIRAADVALTAATLAAPGRWDDPEFDSVRS